MKDAPLAINETTSTVVYNANGEEIDRKEGIVTINARDYADYLPVTYKQIKTTTEILNSIRLEKNVS
jgi:DNA-binding protein